MSQQVQEKYEESQLYKIRHSAAHIMAQARAVGVPTAEVLGVEHVEHDGELLSFPIQHILPGRSLDELDAKPIPGTENGPSNGPARRATSWAAASTDADATSPSTR